MSKIQNNSEGSRARHIRAILARRSDQFYSVAWSSDGKRIASGSSDNTLRIWDADNGGLLLSLGGHMNSIWTVVWSPDGSKLVSGSSDSTVRIWESTSGQLLWTLEGHTDSVRGIAWSPDGSKLVSGSGDKTMRIWDASTGQLLLTIEGHSNPIRSVEWSPDGSKLASGSYDRTVRIWDANSGRFIRSIEGHSDSVRSVSWSPDGRTLASGSYDKTVRIWDVDSGQSLSILEGHLDWVQSVNWSPDGNKLASASDDKTVRIWDAARAQLLHTFNGHSNSVRSVAWAPTGSKIVSGSHDKTIRIWDVVNGQLLHTLRSRARSVATAVWSPNGKRLVSGWDDGTLNIWDANSGELVRGMVGHNSSSQCVDWSPDGCNLASAADDNIVYCWDAETGQLVLTLEDHISSVETVSWSPCGERLASGSYDNTVKIWNTKNGELLRSLEGHTHYVQSVGWSPDGRKLASGSYDKMVRIWDTDSGQLVLTFEGHLDWIQTLAWSPDGRKLASASDDKTIRVWDATTGQLLRTLEGHTNSVRSVRWSPDGNVLVTSSDDNTVRVWSAITGAQLHVEQVFSAYYPLFASFEEVSHVASTFGRAESGDDDIIVRCIDLSSIVAGVISEVKQSVSAKIVLIGESNVGKSCLALRLAKNEYKEEDTTHGMRLWKIPAEEFSPTISIPSNEQRYVVIWDMGGQDEYRMIHQLFLSDTSLALILFDPTRGEAAIDDVYEWSLRLENQVSGRKAIKLLVGTKLDRPTHLLDRSAISNLVANCQCGGFFETSAKLGLGIDELRSAIANLLKWDKLSKTTSPTLFHATRKVIDESQQNGEVVLLYDELTARVRQSIVEEFDSGAVDTVVDQLARQGMIAMSWLSTHERALILQIGYIETYGCSLLIAARNNASGVAAIEISEALNLKFYPGINDAVRPDRLKERIILECVIELLIKRGICFRHQELLIFPALFPPSLLKSERQRTETVSLYYEFTGSIDNIYSSLIVRLALSERFGRVRLWKDRAEFERTGQGMCGFRKIEKSSGWAQLDLLFSTETQAEARELFTVFVEEHLRNEGIKIQEVLGMVCGRCGNSFAELSVRKRVSDGYLDIGCEICDARWPISLGAQQVRETDQRIRKEILALKTIIAKRQRAEANLITRRTRLDEPNSKDAIHILHLSDLHLTPEANPLSSLQALAQDLRDKQGGLGLDYLDYVVVSGDLTNTASEKEFDQCYLLLSELISQFRISAERCIIVPGNHDLSWDTEMYEWKHKRKVELAKLKPGSFKAEGDGYLIRIEEDYMKRFDNFRKFYHQLTQRPYPLLADEQGLSFLFERTGLQFLTFNSSWQIDEYYRERSAIKEEALANALLNADKQLRNARMQNRIAEDQQVLRLAVWHHPVTGNEKIADDAFVERLRDVGVVLGLHGHVHEDRAEMISYTHPRKIRVAGSGSFGATPRDRPASMPQLYNLIEIAHDHSRIRVHTRAKSKEGGSWRRWSVWPDRSNERDNSYYDIDLRDSSN